METEKLFSVLSALHPISFDFRFAVERVLTPLSLPPYHMLQEATRVTECAYFLDEGFAMTYTFTKGEKQVERFWHAGQIMLSPRSFFEQIPSPEFIQLRTRSELLCITHNNLLHLSQRFPEARFIYGVMMSQYHEYSRERMRDLYYLSAVDRYEKLIRHFPDVEQHVAQKYIASRKIMI